LFHLPSLAAGVESHVPPTPRFFSTFALDYEIQADPEQPVAWLGFLNELWPDDPECIATLQEFMGYSLTPDTSHQKILLTIGPPRSGKGTIAKVMTGLVGERNVSGPTASSLKTNFGLQDLVGKLLAIIADAQLKRHDDGLVERLKMISGEDRIMIDRKYADPFSAKLPTRLVIMSNDLPRFKDASGALANRMLILRLTKSFLGREDRTLGARLLRERPGILSWAVAGWKRLNDRGRFVQPASGQPLLDELQDLGSQVGQFVRESCQCDNRSATTPRNKLYNAYQKWCVGKGHDYPLAANTFGVELRSVVAGLGDAHPVIEGKQVRCYTGISLRE
jgi:putative DNA primase/helicase